MQGKNRKLFSEVFEYFEKLFQKDSQVMQKLFQIKSHFNGSFLENFTAYSISQFFYIFKTQKLFYCDERRHFIDKPKSIMITVTENAGNLRRCACNREYLYQLYPFAPLLENCKAGSQKPAVVLSISCRRFIFVDHSD